MFSERQFWIIYNNTLVDIEWIARDMEIIILWWGMIQITVSEWDINGKSIAHGKGAGVRVQTKQLEFGYPNNM